MADPTKVVRFPNRKKLHLVWSSPSLKDSDETAQESENASRQPDDATVSTSHQSDDESITPTKTD